MLHHEHDSGLVLVPQAHLKPGGDVKVLLHVGAQDLVDAAAAHMLDDLTLQRCKLYRTNNCQNNAPEKGGKSTCHQACLPEAVDGPMAPQATLLHKYSL